jgi:23S rRNA-intervening sequence protein
VPIKTYKDLKFFANRIVWLWMFPERRADFRRRNSLNWSGNFEGLPALSLPISWKAGQSGTRHPSLSRYLQVAIGFCDECKLWLEMSRDEGYLPVAECDQLSNRFNVVGAMLKSLWKQWQTYSK